jgi:hypothetical protein
VACPVIPPGSSVPFDEHDDNAMTKRKAATANQQERLRAAKAKPLLDFINPDITLGTRALDTSLARHLKMTSRFIKSERTDDIRALASIGRKDSTLLKVIQSTSQVEASMEKASESGGALTEGVRKSVARGKERIDPASGLVKRGFRNAKLKELPSDAQKIIRETSTTILFPKEAK